MVRTRAFRVDAPRLIDVQSEHEYPKRSRENAARARGLHASETGRRDRRGHYGGPELGRASPPSALRHAAEAGRRAPGQSGRADGGVRGRCDFRGAAAETDAREAHPMKVRAIIHAAPEGGFWAEVPALPGCIT